MRIENENNIRDKIPNYLSSLEKWDKLNQMEYNNGIK